MSKEEYKQDSSSPGLSESAMAGELTIRGSRSSRASNLDNIFSHFAGFFLFVGFASAGLYYFFQPKSHIRSPASVAEDFEEHSELEGSIDAESRAKRRGWNIKLDIDQAKRTAEMEAIDSPPLDAEAIEPEPSAIPVDSMIQPSRSKKIVDDLTKPPFNPDIETPEDIIRRKISHDKWLDSYLLNRNERERQRFIKHFIREAKAQGYEVYFQGGMKFILKPAKKEKENLEEMKVYVK